jgi:predicted ABC-type ATPase
MSPNVYIVAGPNGAGKTTFAKRFLMNYAQCRVFINADLIAAGISPLDPEAAAIRAGRLMLEEIDLQASRGTDFGFETTLAGRAHLDLIQKLKQRGYTVNLYFLWVPTTRLAQARVRARVIGGGHSIPDPVVIRRFDRSIRNFLQLYRHVVDNWILFDNAEEEPRVIAQRHGPRTRIIQEEAYDRLNREYGGANE